MLLSHRFVTVISLDSSKAFDTVRLYTFLKKIISTCDVTTAVYVVLQPSNNGSSG